jgi:hypothetical protein
VPTSARIAALMCSGNIGHAAMSAESSGSACPPSFVLSLRPALHPTAPGITICLFFWGLRRGTVGFWFSLSRFESWPGS